MLIVLSASVLFLYSLLNKHLSDVMTADNIYSFYYAILHYQFYVIAFIIPIHMFRKRVHGRAATFWLTLPVSPQIYVLSAALCGTVWFAVSSLLTKMIIFIANRSSYEIIKEALKSSLLTTAHAYAFLLYLELAVILSTVIYYSSCIRHSPIAFIFAVAVVLFSAGVYYGFTATVDKVCGFSNDSMMWYVTDIVYFAIFAVGFYALTAIMLNRYEPK